MAASQKQVQTIFVLEIFTHILHFLLWCHVKGERIFMIFLNIGFSEKRKHAELALNFLQKQKFS